MGGISKQSFADKYFKGYFADEAAILALYPNTIAVPATRAGWNAVNADTDTIWIWDVGTNAWVDGDLKGEVSSVFARTGDVVATASDYDAVQIDNGSAMEGTFVKDALDRIKQNWLDRQEPNGFIDKTEVTLSFANVGRTLTITKVGADFTIWSDSVRYTKTANVTKQIGTAEGLHYVYFDSSGDIQETTTWSDDLLEKYCIVAMIYWDASNNLSQLFAELHGIQMDGKTHDFLHDTMGAQYVSGLALENFVIDQNGADNEDAQFSVATGIISDEDLSVTINAVAKTTGLTIFYLDGANWRWTTNAGYSILTGGANRMAYNNAGAQADVTNNKFALCHVFATNLNDGDPIAIQGQAQYNTKSAARDGANSEVNTLILSGLPNPEYKWVGTVIFQTSNGMGNAVKSATVSTDAGGDYVDGRSEGGSSSVVNPAVTSVDGKTGAVDGRGLQVYHVGKHGVDTNDGKSYIQAFLTFGAAVTAATALTPSVSNQFCIIGDDAGVYAENIALIAYISIFAPLATFTGNHTMTEFSKFTAYEIGAASGTILTKASAGSSFLKVDKITATSSATGIVCSAGTLHVDIGYCLDNSSEDGITSTGGTINGNVDRIYAPAAGSGIKNSSTGQIALTINALIQDTGAGIGAEITNGTTYLLCGFISASNKAWNLTGGTLSIVASSLTLGGSEVGAPNIITSDENYDVVIMEAGAFNYSAVNPAVLDTDTGAQGAIKRQLFDDSTPEFVLKTFRVTDKILPTGTVIIGTWGYAKIAVASKNIEWTFYHSIVAAGATWDTAYATKVSGDLACNGTQDFLDNFEFTETVANLVWVGGRHVRVKFGRTAPSAANLADDYGMIMAYLKIPKTNA